VLLSRSKNVTSSLPADMEPSTIGTLKAFIETLFKKKSKISKMKYLT